MPSIGMESEFNVWLDDVEIDPKPFWKTPGAFIDRQLLPREKSSLQLPTGGAVYFDRGVIEVVTPVIELAPNSTARMVRNLWEQIGFVRDQLTKWEKANDHTVRLKGYSSHYNITYEIPKRQQTKTRNEKLLALLLTHILPAGDARRIEPPFDRRRREATRRTDRSHGRLRPGSWPHDRGRDADRRHRPRGDDMAVVRVVGFGRAADLSHLRRCSGQAHDA